MALLALRVRVEAAEPVPRCRLGPQCPSSPPFHLSPLPRKAVWPLGFRAGGQHSSSLDFAAHSTPANPLPPVFILLSPLPTHVTSPGRLVGWLFEAVQLSPPGEGAPSCQHWLLPSLIVPLIVHQSPVSSLQPIRHDLQPDPGDGTRSSAYCPDYTVRALSDLQLIKVTAWAARGC